MKSTLSTFLIPFTVLIFTVSEGAPLRCFWSGAVIQHGRPTPTPTPYSPGSIPPGNIGGAHRTSAGAGEASGAMAAPGSVPAAGNEGTLKLFEKIETPMVPAIRYASPYRHRRSRSAGLFTYSPTSETVFPEPCDPAKQLQNELSGVYFGSINFEGLDLRGGATLGICGNEFTLVQREKKASGMVASVTTSGYTAAAFRFTEVTGFEVPLLSGPKTVSVTVSRSRGSSSFRSAPGESHKFTFIESRERRARSKPVTPSRKL